MVVGGTAFGGGVVITIKLIQAYDKNVNYSMWKVRIILPTGPTPKV